MKNKKVLFVIPFALIALMGTGAVKTSKNTSYTDYKEIIKKNAQDSSNSGTINTSVANTQHLIGFKKSQKANGNGEYRFFLFDLGEIEGLPIYSSDVYRYSGYPYSVTLTTTTSTESSYSSTFSKTIEDSVTTSKTVGVSNVITEEDTLSVEEGVNGESSATIGASVTAGVDYGLYSAEAEVSAEASVSAGWNLASTQSHTSSFSFENSTEKTNASEKSQAYSNTYETYQSYCEEHSESLSVSFGSENGISKCGYYRFTKFIPCNVYAYLILDTELHKYAVNYTIKPNYNGTTYTDLEYSSSPEFSYDYSNKFYLTKETVQKYYNNIYNVTFNSNGGTSCASQQVLGNRTLNDYPRPTKYGFVFEGWYTDSALTKRFDEDGKITDDTTLYANYLPDNNVKFNVTVNSATGGSTSKTGTTAVPCGDLFTVSATPATGYKFVCWRKNGSVFTTDKTLEDTVLGTASYCPQFSMLTSNSATLTYATGSSSTSEKSYTLNPRAYLALGTASSQGYKYVTINVTGSCYNTDGSSTTMKISAFGQSSSTSVYGNGTFTVSVKVPLSNSTLNYMNGTFTIKPNSSVPKTYRNVVATYTLSK